ncbi:MAG: multicopper oxidase domain-containing protein [Nitrospiraceae bacterium]|nr:MAG: multicopper oxidase domain-containing protein [Nitrospiraceae bacterium]
MQKGRVFTGVLRIFLPVLLITLICSSIVFAQALTGGTVDPGTIPKYVIPLVIPPVMKHDGMTDSYDIAVRQFKQQILPGGIWNTLNGRSDNFKATQIWSYGPAADPTPTVAPDPNSQFNYPAYTVETMSNTEVNVRWINDLVDAKGKYLPHLLPVDQTVHWANPPMDCRDGMKRTDCMGTNPEHYQGPVPIVTHVHGAHVDPHSDGYPEAWWLPAAKNIPGNYATSGSLFDDATLMNPGNLGYADYSYRQDQPATTLWYHDHTLGMTRLNVYAGPAGFWLIRGGLYDGGDDVSTPGMNDAVLPGPAPAAGEGVVQVNFPSALGGERGKYREIPIAIQDRSFDQDGAKLFYPKQRAFFEGVDPKDLKIDYAPYSDVLPTWQPEAFFNVMVVNGVSWPSHEVAQDRYRFRLLNGCNSRFLNLALFVVTGPGPDGISGTGDDTLGQEIPIYQIGAEQGFLPQVVMISTGFATPLPGNGTVPAPVPAPDPDQALLMGLAERADVIVDFSGLPNGTVVRMINTGPDEPFGGFDGAAGEEAVADPGTTGQVMQFVVNAALNNFPGSTDGTTTAPEDLVLNAEGPLGALTNTTPRNVSLNELMSEVVCVLLDPDADEFIVPIKQVDCLTPSPTPEGYEVVPFGPTEALLGTVSFPGGVPTGNPLKWTALDAGIMKTVNVPAGPVDVWVTENPALNAVEEWDIYNFTADAHPIHLHLVRFEVVGRSELDGTPIPVGSVQPWETGFKDTVIAYPGQITKVKALFDVAGLYVWHCHIVEHEDNEMMRPYYVGP